jgi:hypothetical protein
MRFIRTAVGAAWLAASLTVSGLALEASLGARDACA